MTSLSARDAARVSDDVEARAFEALYAVAPAPLAAQLGLRTERVADATLLLAPGIPDAMFNRAIGLGLREPATADAVQSIMGRFRAAGSRTWWMHWNPFGEPHGFDTTLASLGFTAPRRRSWAKMLRGPESLPQVATDLRIAPARPDQMPGVARVVAASFDMPPFMTDWLQQLQSGPWRTYAVLDGDTVVGGGSLFLEGETAWLGVAGVAPSHRRRGGQGALMARRIADAAAAGARRIVTETGEPTEAGEPNPSLANMKRCGFETVASRLNYAAPA